MHMKQCGHSRSHRLFKDEEANITFEITIKKKRISLSVISRMRRTHNETIFGYSWTKAYL